MTMTDEEVQDILQVAYICLKQHKLRDRVGIHLDLSDEYLKRLLTKLHHALTEK
jgi:hypothetical protein